jgi:hypothetical protein
MLIYDIPDFHRDTTDIHKKKNSSFDQETWYRVAFLAGILSKTGWFTYLKEYAFS